jgi:hypothetical protein
LSFVELLHDSLITEHGKVLFCLYQCGWLSSKYKKCQWSKNHWHTQTNKLFDIYLNAVFSGNIYIL